MAGSRGSALGIALAIMCPFAASPAAAQSCQGIRVEVGAGEQGCIRPGAGEPFKDCPDCPEMVAVPAASFTMGASPNELVATQREDRVLVSMARPFAIGKYAVTRGEFAAFVAATGRKMESGCYRLGVRGRNPELDWRSPGFVQTDHHPVVCVSWHDAKAYVAWLSSRTGKHYRLPSEAEREFVARAGSTTPFWWGDGISTDQANYDGRITYAVGGAAGEWRNSTVAVFAFLANPWGLHNVHGNVWDWTEDCWNEKNAGNPGDGTARSDGDCSFRVVRGGSFNNAPHTLRAARREREPADNRIVTFGFRVARSF
jgi:formylglycine-generating enzyme required for sulfatase activity